MLWGIMAFKTMQWIRKVRDDDYKECRTMSPAQKIAYTELEIL